MCLSEKEQVKQLDLGCQAIEKKEQNKKNSGPTVTGGVESYNHQNSPTNYTKRFKYMPGASGMFSGLPHRRTQEIACNSTSPQNTVFPYSLHCLIAESPLLTYKGNGGR